MLDKKKNSLGSKSNCQAKVQNFAFNNQTQFKTSSIVRRFSFSPG